MDFDSFKMPPEPNDEAEAIRAEFMKRCDARFEQFLTEGNSVPLLISMVPPCPSPDLLRTLLRMAHEAGVNSCMREAPRLVETLIKLHKQNRPTKGE